MRDEYVTLWRGRSVADLSREQLLEIIEQLGREIQQFYTDDAIEMRALGRIEQIRRENHNVVAQQVKQSWWYWCMMRKLWRAQR